MEQKKTLIILSPGFAKNEYDTTCLPAQQLLLKEINKLYPSLEVIILAFQYPFQNKKYIWYGNSVISFNGRNKNKISRLLLWSKILLKLRKLKRQKNIAGIFSCWCTECALIGKYFAKANKLPHFIWICGQDARATNKMVKWIRPNADALIAISKSIQDEFFKNHQIKPKHIIENGVAANMFPAGNNERHIDILGVGSLIPLKQFEIFIRIVYNLKKNRPDVKAMLSGEGSERNKLQSLIETLQLQDTVTLTGEKPHDDILRYMQQSKILLHPSSYEGFSGACIEALYAGAHVVSFCSAVNRPINHWHIVTNLEEMYQKVLDILNDTNTDNTSVLVNDMERSAKKLMQLYNVEL